MAFILLAAIFLTSTGFLVSASLAPTTAATMLPDSETTAPQPHPDLPGIIAPFLQQDPNTTVS